MTVMRKQRAISQKTVQKERVTVMSTESNDCSVQIESVAVCCSVLQRVAVCCSVLQCVTVCCNEHKEQ